MRNIKNLKICLLLLGLVTISLQTNAGGYESVKIRANDDPQACILSLTVTPSANSITFTETIDRTNSTSCSFPNPQFVSQFTNQPLSNQVVLNPTADANVYQGVMSVSDLAALNGTACFNYMTAGAVKWYLCRMKYGLNILFEFSVIMAPNSDVIDPSWTNLFFPIYLTSYVGKNFVWFKDPILWGPLVAKMSQTCGTWSSNIPSASTPVKLTGTIQSSSEVNLHNYFHSHQVYGAVIKPTGAPAGQYIVTSINNMAFSTNTNSSCADLGINYGQLLGGNMNYCKNGCDVALILIQGSYYILQTSGFTYVPPALRG